MLEALSPAARTPRRPAPLTSAANAFRLSARQPPSRRLRDLPPPAPLQGRWGPDAAGGGDSTCPSSPRPAPGPAPAPSPALSLASWFASYTDAMDGVSTNLNPHSSHTTVRNSTATRETTQRATAAGPTPRNCTRAAGSRAAAHLSRTGSDLFPLFLLATPQGSAFSSRGRERVAVGGRRALDTASRSAVCWPLGLRQVTGQVTVPQCLHPPSVPTESFREEQRRQYPETAESCT